MRTTNTYPTSRVPTAVLATGPPVAAAPEPPPAPANPIDGRLVIVVVGPEPANVVDEPKPIATLVAGTVADVDSVETVILRKILVTPVTPLQRAL